MLEGFELDDLEAIAESLPGPHARTHGVDALSPPPGDDAMRQNAAAPLPEAPPMAALGLALYRNWPC
jgi:hypothetical protein